MLNTLTPTVVGLLVFVATSRTLGPADFGIVAMAASVTTIASALIPAGFGQALVQRLEISRDHLNAAFWFSLAVATAGYTVLLVSAGSIARLLSTPILAVLIPILGLRVFLDMAALVPNALLLRQMAYKLFAARTLAASVVSACVCLLLLVLGLGFWALAFSQLVSSLALSLGSVIAARWQPDASFKLWALKELGWYGTVESLDRGLVTLALDQVIIGSTLGTLSLGLYNFSRRTVQLLTDAISGGLNSVSYTLMASLQSDREKVRTAFLLATFLSCSVCFPTFVGLALVAEDLVPLAFGEHWQPAVPVLRCFCATGLLVPLTVLQSSLVKSQGRPHYWLLYNLFKLLMTVGTVLYFGRYGINTLALALVASTYLAWAPSALVAARLIDIPLWQYLGSFGRPALCAIIMSGYVLGVDALSVEQPPLVRLSAMISTGAAIYGLLFLVMAHRDIWRALRMIRKPTAA